MGEKIFRLFVTLSLFVVLTGCASQTTKFDDKFNQLSARMNTTDVQNLLGPPSLKELKDKVETWHYTSAGEGRYVQFQDGQVIGFGRDNPLLSSSPPPSFNKTIGESCSHDGDCQSRDCHFGHCVGKNNCRSEEGQVCASDADCCTQWCDFGVCRKKR